jgi:hypothetical protein
MKKLSFNSGKVLLALGFCWISLNCNSQNIKLTRQEQKAANNAQLYANFQAIDTLLKQKRFVLEADFLENQYGERVPVSSTINFVRVDTTEVVLQTGSNFRMGSNGVGGVTAEGKLDNYSIDKNFKTLSYFIKFNVMTNVGIYNITILIKANNDAQATITGTWSGKLVYDGELKALYNSRAFKGQISL